MSEPGNESQGAKKNLEVGKIGHRRVTNKGVVTYKQKTTSEIQKAIQLGIKISVSLSHQKVKRDMLLKDFGVVETLPFPRTGSKNTPQHDLSDFKFKTFAPIAFRYFRDVFQVNVNDFLNSLCDQELQELSNAGASGSIFYITLDDEFIIKTVQHKEASFLQKLLPEYYINLIQHPRTLLPKFYGLYCYQTMGKNIRFVIMNNLLPSITIHERYDLKGSTYKRMASAREKDKDSPTLKDLDFRDNHKEGIYLEIETYDALLNTIQRDCRVLESFSIMDYSLLLGIHNLDKTKNETKRANRESQQKLLDLQLSMDELKQKPKEFSKDPLHLNRINENDYDLSETVHTKTFNPDSTFPKYSTFDSRSTFNIKENRSKTSNEETPRLESEVPSTTQNTNLTKKYKKLEDVVVAVVVKNESSIGQDPDSGRSLLLNKEKRSKTSNEEAPRLESEAQSNTENLNLTKYKKLEDVVMAALINNELSIGEDPDSGKSNLSSKNSNDLNIASPEYYSLDKIEPRNVSVEISNDEKHAPNENYENDVSDTSISDSEFYVLEWANIRTSKLRDQGNKIMEISFRNLVEEYLLVIGKKLLNPNLLMNPLKWVQCVLVLLETIVYYLFFRDCDKQLYHDNEIPSAVFSSGSSFSEDYTNRIRNQSIASQDESFVSTEDEWGHSIDSYEIMNNFSNDKQSNQNHPSNPLKSKKESAESSRIKNDNKKLETEVKLNNNTFDNTKSQLKILKIEDSKSRSDTKLNRQDSRMKSIKRIAAYSTVMESIQAPVEEMDLGSSEEEIVPSGGIPARNSAGDRLILFMGIIDILQSYRFSKKMEHNMKAIFLDAQTISVCNPTFYALRFQDFFGGRVFMKITSSMKTQIRLKKAELYKKPYTRGLSPSRKYLFNTSSENKLDNEDENKTRNHAVQLINELRNTPRRSTPFTFKDSIYNWKRRRSTSVLPSKRRVSSDQ